MGSAGEVGPSGRHLISGQRAMRSNSTRAETNKHDRSSANVTANKITAATTTCCPDKHSHNTASALRVKLAQADQHRNDHPPHVAHSSCHLGRHVGHLANNCNCQHARDNYSYEWTVSSSSPAGLAEGAIKEERRPGAPPSGHTKVQGCRSSGARIISPPLVWLAALALAHFQCHTTISAGSLGPAAGGDLYGEGALGASGALARQEGEPASESWRAQAQSARDLRDARLEKLNVNMSNVFEVIFRKRPYSKYWTVEQKWDDLFRRAMAVQGTVRQLMVKNFMRDIEYYADLTISAQCEKDLKFIQNYAKQSSNFRWLAHMLDSTGKSEPGMLTGMLAHMGHPVQCIKVRAPASASNDTFDERFFDEQTRVLGERFRGKYCLASIRPVLPSKPHLVSRFSGLMNESLLSNISYTGEPAQTIKMRTRQLSVPPRDSQLVDRQHLRLDQVPFESELYQYLIAQRNFMYSLPRFMGVCYPSSCTRDDIRASIQKTLDEQHQVVDIEFECEQEERSAWDWFITPRLIAYVLLSLVVGLVFLVSFARYVLLSKMQIRRSKLDPAGGMASLLNALDMFSMDKCAGILFVKTQRASPLVDWTKVENNRSTAIDALRGFLALMLVYSQMTLLGCLPVPFMWSKWSDEMFPFYRSAWTQPFINLTLWSEAFYLISAYMIALKCFENFRPRIGANGAGQSKLNGNSGVALPNMFSFAIKRYLRLAMPLLAFILLNYLWPRLSNGFVFQDQSSRLMRACDTNGWTNMLLFHNHFPINETCLWPSHVSASFFQLHLLSYPLIALCLTTLWLQFNDQFDNEGKLLRRRNMLIRLLTMGAFALMAAIGVGAAAYAAWQASSQQLIVPFLIDYLDYDNYQRVIEWMVLPTYNHATSYVIGIALAFVVIKRKASNELRRMEASVWFETVPDGSAPIVGGQAIEREGSADSVRSSSTQELRDGLALNYKHSAKFRISPTPSSVCASSHRGHEDEQDEDGQEANTDASLTRATRCSWPWTVFKSSLVALVLLMSLLASWLWNGLGQPMSAQQTFWYVFASKLAFALSFAYLFHEHFATRRNSSNPWIITRFLVPIGRMSLSVFYVSWIVIWFDLLSSLYQWHPSHYFLFEKYNEIIFMTLLVSMLVYGAFEGIIKRSVYATRLERVRGDAKLEERRAELMSELEKSAALGEGDAARQLALRQLLANNRQRRRVKAFESFFEAPDKCDMLAAAAANKQQQPTAESNRAGSMPGDKVAAGQTGKVEPFTVPAEGRDQQLEQEQQRQSVGQSSSVSHSAASFANLTPADRCLLNAELRANYSFASINLYENAGATGDLSNLNRAAYDPQASPALSQRR